MAKLLAFVPLLAAIAVMVAVDARTANAAVACGPNGCFYRQPVRGYCGPNGCVYPHPYRGYAHYCRARVRIRPGGIE
jgi:hypothetical protein